MSTRLSIQYALKRVHLNTVTLKNDENARFMKALQEHIKHRNQITNFKENVVEVSVRAGYSDPVGISATNSAGAWWSGQSLGTSGNLTSSWQNISYSAANVNTSTYPYIVIYQFIGTKEWSLGAFWYRLKIKVQ